jgi:hypothetical protein
LDDIATELKDMPQNNFVPIGSSEWSVKLKLMQQYSYWNYDRTVLYLGSRKLVLWVLLKKSVRNGFLYLELIFSQMRGSLYSVGM